MEKGNENKDAKVQLKETHPKKNCAKSKSGPKNQIETNESKRMSNELIQERQVHYTFYIFIVVKRNRQTFSRSQTF